MGVVRERKSNACSCNANQPQEEVEVVEETTAHSEAEDDLTAILIETASRRQQPKLTFDDLPILKRNTGKRKARRYFNKRNLETLVKNDDGNDNLLEYYKTPFERLMETAEDALDFLNEFLMELEGDAADGSSFEPITHCEDPYMRISHKIRRSMKLRKNFPSAGNREVEEALIEFFKKSPFEIFDRLPANSFERLFMHALAQYHDLRSQNLLDDERVRVEIRNEKDRWTPVDCNLCDLLVRTKS